MRKRDYKNFSAGDFVHIYNRGNNREKIFFEEKDYRAFLFRLGLCLGLTNEELQVQRLTSLPYSRIRITGTNKNNFRLHTFCLMPNHFHLLVEQIGDVPISNLMSKLCTSYAKYINKKLNRIGHVFQDCFKAVHIDDNSQLMWTSSYIHMNPVKDGIVKTPSEYRWSSYQDFVTDRNLPIVSKQFLSDIFGGIEELKKETLNFTVKETL